MREFHLCSGPIRVQVQKAPSAPSVVPWNGGMALCGGLGVFQVAVSPRKLCCSALGGVAVLLDQLSPELSAWPLIPIQECRQPHHFECSRTLPRKNAACLPASRRTLVTRCSSSRSSKIKFCVSFTIDLTCFQTLRSILSLQFGWQSHLEQTVYE